MCAINGCTFRDEKLIEAMNAATKHRGPDQTNRFVHDRVSLGHNRLKIIDLSERSAQPMVSADGRRVIVFNGEIYNFRDLRARLDYPWKSEGDTEVILAAYERYGVHCVKHLNGIFAFAIWDEEKHELFLARDPLGVKPLYYAIVRDVRGAPQMIFSSELKAVLEYPMSRTLDREALADYLHLLYVPGPRTMVRGVFKFPPAHYGVFRDGALVTTRYWDVAPGDRRVFPREEYGAALRERVSGAVTRQLISDRPLGIYLSGGIDSSVVLDCVSRVRGSIDTYSIGFELSPDEEQEKFNADSELARTTAAAYGTRHHEVMLAHGDVVPLLEQAVFHLDEPIANPTVMPMLALAAFAKQTVDVVLGGDGGDELFGGYERYRLARIARAYQRAPAALRKLFDRYERLRKLNTPPGADLFRLFMFQKDPLLKRFARSDAVPLGHTQEFFRETYFKAAHPGVPIEETLMDVDRRTWLVDESLMRTDKMSMAHGLEARVPLLDKDLVEFAVKIPASEKVTFRTTKRLFKDAFRDRIPRRLLSQPKRGWFAPGAKWLRREDIAAFVREVFSGAFYAPSEAYIDWGEARKLFEAHVAKETYAASPLWALLMFQLWMRRYRVGAS